MRIIEKITRPFIYVFAILLLGVVSVFDFIDNLFDNLFKKSEKVEELEERVKELEDRLPEQRVDDH